jgi:hypothetical protein
MAEGGGSRCLAVPKLHPLPTHDSNNVGGGRGGAGAARRRPRRVLRYCRHSDVRSIGRRSAGTLSRRTNLEDDLVSAHSISHL